MAFYVATKTVFVEIGAILSVYRMGLLRDSSGKIMNKATVSSAGCQATEDRMSLLRDSGRKIMNKATGSSAGCQATGDRRI